MLLASRFSLVVSETRIFVIFFPCSSPIVIIPCLSLLTWIVGERAMWHAGLTLQLTVVEAEVGDTLRVIIIGTPVIPSNKIQVVAEVSLREITFVRNSSTSTELGLGSALMRASDQVGGNHLQCDT